MTIIGAARNEESLFTWNCWMPILHETTSSNNDDQSSSNPSNGKQLKDLVEDSLVYRYRNENAASDGLSGVEGTFSMCSFWYVEALARKGDLDAARFYFEKMLSHSNRLGLFAEEIGPSGEALGNFPQAFTHIALISAAYDLDRRLDNLASRG